MCRGGRHQRYEFAEGRSRSTGQEAVPGQTAQRVGAGDQPAGRDRRGERFDGRSRLGEPRSAVHEHRHVAEIDCRQRRQQLPGRRRPLQP